MTGPEVTAAMKAEDAWVEKGARAMWNAQTRQPWQQIDDGDEWPSWVDLATRDRLREKFRHALAAVLPEIQALARDLWPVKHTLNDYPIQAVPKSALLERRNRLARLAAAIEEPNDQPKPAKDGES